MATENKTLSDPLANLSYEAALDELQTLLSRLESGQLPLDALLVSYQRAAALLTHCRAQLAALEEQIQIVDSDRPQDGA